MTSARASASSRRSADPFRDSVRQALKDGALLRPGDRVLIGVSGGPDSVALLHALLQLAPALRFTVAVAHVNHGLRPDAGDDAEFVEQLGRRWRVPVKVVACDVLRLVAEEGRSVEDAARRLRYGALERAAVQWSAHRVAVAHTADDQAETVLMRLIRGAGLTGLSAMPASRQLGANTLLIRPLLGLWRRDVESYVARHRLPVRRDATNDDTKFLRNRVRRQLLPLLEQAYNANIKALLVQVAEQSRDDLAYLQDMVRRSWRRFVKPAEGGWLIRSSALLKQPAAVQRAILRAAVVRVQGSVAGFEFRHWREVERLLDSRPLGTVVDLPNGLRLRREAGGLRLWVEAPVPPTAKSDFQDGEFAVY